MRQPKSDRKARIMVDFKSPNDALDFLDQMIEAGIFPDDVGLFMSDALDHNAKSNGITSSNEFIVKRLGDRPYQLKRTTSTEVAFEVEA